MKRLMFGEPLKIRKDELRIWREFLQYVKNTKKEQIPEEVLVDPSRIGMRYLHGLDFNFEAAYKVLMWRLDEYMPTNQSKYEKFLHSGAVYIAGRLDKAGLQPVIVIDIKKFIQMNMEIPELEDNLKFIFNWCVK